MAVAVATPTVTNTISFPGAGIVKIQGTIAIDASPATYATGGLAVSLAGQPGVASNPIKMVISGVAGYTYTWDRPNAKMQIWLVHLVAPSPLEEHAAAAIAAGVSGDTITFDAEFLIGQ